MNQTLVAICPDVVEDIFDNLGLPWKRLEGGWSVPAGARRSGVLHVTPTEDRLNVEVELTSWDNISQPQSLALDLIIRNANQNLATVCCVRQESRAVVLATLSSGEVERKLSVVVQSVLKASRILSRELVAVTTTELAGHVLDFFNQTDSSSKSQ